MSDKQPDGGLAFPTGQLQAGSIHGVNQVGMTLRDYACIHLRIPQTGQDWLDEIIRQSQVNEFAGQALQGALHRKAAPFFGPTKMDELANHCYGQAYAMLEEQADG